MLIAATSGDKPVFIKIPGIAQTFDKIKGEETEFVLIRHLIPELTTKNHSLTMLIN